MPGCASSPSSARCAPSPSCGTRSPPTRYGVNDPKQRLFRYGVQVNSLGLTEQQPENNVTRILIEMLAVTLSKNARARAVQLPAWNEALGLPRPWDQQWSLRMQQILAYETDLLEYGDIFDGSPAIAAKVAELKREAKEELAHIEALGGAVAPVEQGYMKRQLVEFEHAAASRRSSAASRPWSASTGSSRPKLSPLADAADAIVTVSPQAEAEQIERLKAWRAARDQKAVTAALEEAARGRCARTATSCRPRSPAPKPALPPANGASRCAKASASIARRPASGAPSRNETVGLDDLRAEVDRVSRKLGRRLKFVVGKPGLDGHSNGAEQIAVRARDAGMDVVYEGIRLTPAEIVEAACAQGAHVVGLSILSGSHLPLVTDVVARMRSGRPRRTCRWWSAASSRPRTRRCSARRASPRSIRPRTSSSTGSWPTSCASWRSVPAKHDTLRNEIHSSCGRAATNGKIQSLSVNCRRFGQPLDCRRRRRGVLSLDWGTHRHDGATIEAQRLGGSG